MQNLTPNLMDKIDVIIADDHTLVRKGILNLLKTFNRIGEIKEAENGKKLLDLLQVWSPTVVLVDIAMPVMDGFTICEIIISKYPAIKIIVVSMYDEESYVAKMLELGVHGYLTKNADPEEIERAIYSVVDIDFYQNELVISILRKMLQNKPLKRDSANLTAREIEILSLICKELSYKEISDQLCISEKTIHNHRNHIMDKIGAKNTISLVKYAYQNGYLIWSPESTKTK
jgi:two-component system response regulator DegU